MKRLSRLAAPAAMLLLAACANSLAAAETVERIDYRAVESIQVFRTSDSQAVNAGTVLGGFAGGVIGHQIGSGRGNTAATIAGAIGGAMNGNEVQKSHVQVSWYRIAVRLDSGTKLILEDTREVDLRVGDRVWVENNRIYRI